MNLITIYRYLFQGSYQAMERIARSRGAIGVGLVFVFAAGLAREYDGEDLLHEPWHLLIPLAASLATSFILFLLIAVVSFVRGVPWSPFWSRYRQLLALYWMTAPLAWLYAIPFERHMTAADAVRANLMLLAVVALWRVVLMVRVVAKLLDCGYWPSFFLVMLFADTVLLTVAAMLPVPVVQFMGGVRLTESESLIQGVTLSVHVLGGLSWPIWLLGVLVLLARWRRGMRYRWTISAGERPGQVGPGVWGVAAASIALFVLIAGEPQREQRLRRQAEQLLVSGRIADGLRFMSAHERADFPPHWSPPPRIAYAHVRPPLIDVLRALGRLPAAEWVRNHYFSELRRLNQHDDVYYWDNLFTEQKTLQAWIELLESNPDVRAQMVYHRGFSHSLKYVREHQSSKWRTRIDRILAQLGHLPPAETDAVSANRADTEHALPPPASESAGPE
jgi:hypothetical protein